MWALRRRIQQSHGTRVGAGEKSRRQFFVLKSSISFLRMVRAEIAALEGGQERPKSLGRSKRSGA